jgi:hypothetical protein
MQWEKLEKPSGRKTRRNFIETPSIAEGKLLKWILKESGRTV